MSKKTENRFNPFAVSSAEEIVSRVKRILDTAPPFGSPENIAQLHAARKEGEQFKALLTSPTNTLPH
jgi:hypothetical protein